MWSSSKGVTTTKSKGSPASEKTLLHGVHAQAQAGEILAVVGPSGAGKSTLLDAVAGRISAASLGGSILVNGAPMVKGFRRISAYVMQDDALFAQLTVRETLMYSARLRLPAAMSTPEKAARVADLIQVLGLAACADTFIGGDDDVRGVSGGERRRASIGVELIHDPAVLILDEPTSGLDSTSALNVMQTLHLLATERKRTVILTIHQPSYRMLDLVHSLVLLAQGHVVYHGPTPDLHRHLAHLGIPVPEHVNILEYALEVVKQHEAQPGGLAPLLAGNQAASIDEEAQAAAAAGSPPPPPPPILAAAAAGLEGLREERPQFATGVWAELCTLCERSTKTQLRSRGLFLSRVTVMVVMGLTAGSLFFNCAPDARGVSNRNSLLAFAVAVLSRHGLSQPVSSSAAPCCKRKAEGRAELPAGGSAALCRAVLRFAVLFGWADADLCDELYRAVLALPGSGSQERQIFVRETSRGAYRTLSYVLANALASLPIFALLSVVFASAAYWLAGLVASAPAFGVFVLACFLTLLVTNAFVLMWSGIAPNYYVANGIVGAAMSYFFLFSGFFLSRKDMPAWWIWLHYFNIFKYPLEILMWNEYDGLKGTCLQGPHTGACAYTGHNVLAGKDMGKVKVGVNIGIILLFSVAFRVGFYYALKARSKGIRK
eukprot:jgi/Mesen1/5753/ME000292S04850